MALNASMPFFPKYFELVRAAAPFSINTARVSKHGQPRDLVSKAERDIAILVMAIAIQPGSDRVHFEILSIRRTITRISDSCGARHPSRQRQSGHGTPLVSVNQFLCEQSHKRQGKKRCPVGEAFHGEHFESASQEKP